MDNGHVLGSQHLIDGILLRPIQIREVHRSKAECLCLLTGVEQITQITQTSFCLDDTVEGIKHRLITGLIEEELNTHILSSLNINKLTIVGHSHHHPVTINITDGTRKREVFDLILIILLEKHHRSSELEIMFYLIIFALTEHLNNELVE